MADRRHLGSWIAYRRWRSTIQRHTAGTPLHELARYRTAGGVLWHLEGAYIGTDDSMADGRFVPPIAQG
jgi:hypothetical protein